MQPITEILAKLNQNSLSHPEEVFTRLFRYMLRPDAYHLAYKHLYANNGAATPGVDKEDTADGYSEEKVQRIIESIRNGTYQPAPVRRTYIEKKNGSGKKRPLGLPTFTDKLVQEVLRMLLEAIYEPVFSPYSHGFRPGRSCHTALKTIKLEFTGIRWFIEGDIKGCFDNIDHQVLIAIISRKIKDARLIQLLWKFLRAGYMENWKYNTTYSGTPQGGIISPILSNIYLNELDCFMAELRTTFEKPRERAFTPEYAKAKSTKTCLKRKIAKSEGEERDKLIAQYKEVHRMACKLPSASQTDKRIRYVRYADDFLIGVSGSREDCEKIKTEIKMFVAEKLHMELSDEKTLITHSNEHARFLSYDIRVRRDNSTRSIPGRLPRRWMNGTVELNIPLKDKVEKFLYAHKIVIQKEGQMFPTWRRYMVGLTPLEIITVYNSELSGLCNYYSMASNFNSLQYFAYLMEYSCLKTLAAKANSTIRQTIAYYNDGSGKWGVPYDTKQGKKRRYFADYRESKAKKLPCVDGFAYKRIMYNNARNSLEMRLKAKVCELCGSTDAQSYQIHHVHKVKDLKGKEPWEQCMIAKRRKTLILCNTCHNRIHHGNKSEK